MKKSNKAIAVAASKALGKAPTGKEVLASLKLTNFFPNWIGQGDVINYLNQVVNLVSRGELFPLQPLFLEGFAGLGKTSLAKLLAEVLAPYGFQFVEISSSITLPSFIQLWGNLLEGKQAVIFIDECSQVVKNKKVLNLLKRILETQKSVGAVAHDSGHLTANPFQHLWCFASNEEPKDSAIFGPSSRTKGLLLLPYTGPEVEKIITQKAAKWGIEVDKDAVSYLAGRVMSNGRAISELVENELLMFAKLSGGKVSLPIARALVEQSKRFPLGLRAVDIVTLQSLGTEPRGRQVSELAAICGGEDPKTTGDRLRALAGLGMVLTTGNGRKALTQKGADYMKQLAEMQAKAKALRADSVAETKATKAKEKAKGEGEPKAPKVAKGEATKPEVAKGEGEAK